ncbi:MAG: polysaccharide deacetylase family protein [Candidatus Binatia bacterium]
MAIELNRIHQVRWPSGVRLPIVFTFEHQSGEASPLMPGGRPNYMVGDAMQYGARRGIWNILEMLERYGIKATFFVCGTTAERFPEAVRVAQETGHEIAGMSYSFESVRTASTERERAVVNGTIGALQDLTGVRILGWRCPDYRISPQTLDILIESDFLWDSSLLNDDTPYLFEHGGRRLVEIPFTTSTADKTFVGFPTPQRGGPDGLASVWNCEFEVLYQEGERATRFLILSLQTWLVGRPAVLRKFKQFLERVVSNKGLWYSRCCDIAQCWRDHARIQANRK